MLGAFTRELLSLADWLKQQGVTHVAMEAGWRQLHFRTDDNYTSA